MFEKKGGMHMRHRRSENRQHRASYPNEPDQPLTYRAERNEGGYPDWVVQSEAASAAQAGWAAGGKPSWRKHRAEWAVIAAVCAIVLGFLCFSIVSLYRPYAPFQQKKVIVSQSAIAQGVLVDGVHLGGMSRTDAAAALERQETAANGGLWLTVQVDGQAWIITPNELPLERNTQAVLETAYAVGRQGSPDTIASHITPFEYRYQHLYHTASNPVRLYTTVTYSAEKLRELVRIIEARINRDPMDAQVATFDFASRSFTFTEDSQGARLDAEALYRKITDALDRQQYTASISVSSESIMPKVTRAELMSSFARVSAYSTTTTSDASRNNNINLACRAVTGTAVMPGETFSFNQATGQRTLEKGYLPAAAIAGGTTVDEVGGGVCQVSSTLFNAAVMADLTILARSPHTWPSNYVEKGRDATVNWPNLDFSFRNDKQTPVFIVAYYQQRQCTVEIYGASLGAGASIDLSTQLTAQMDPPREPLYENNPLLPVGTAQEKKKARTGYVVETYKVYKQNGVEVRREWLCTSNYPMIQQVIEYN